MVRMFCTLKEAAETLHANEDLIEALLQRGVLREFREGPHRLIKEADVGELAGRQDREHRDRQQSRAPVHTGRPSSRNNEPQASRACDMHRLRSAAAVPCASVRDTSRPRTARRGAERKSEECRTCRRHRAGRRRERDPARSTSRPVESLPQSESLSVRQWLWSGLIQDRPAAIALLSGLVLLALSALVAGLCLAVEALGVKN